MYGIITYGAKCSSETTGSVNARLWTIIAAHPVRKQQKSMSPKSGHKISVRPLHYIIQCENRLETRTKSEEVTDGQNVSACCHLLYCWKSAPARSLALNEEKLSRMDFLTCTSSRRTGHHCTSCSSCMTEIHYLTLFRHGLYPQYSICGTLERIGSGKKNQQIQCNVIFIKILASLKINGIKSLSKVTSCT